MSRMLSIAIGAALMLAGAASVDAAAIRPIPTDSSIAMKVANGCGANRYRGPNGSCHRYGTGPYPHGYHGPYHDPWRWNGCPKGDWRGPWGHCRDTPFHGRLPHGGWK